MSQTATCGHVRMREKKSTRIIPTKILHDVKPHDVCFPAGLLAF